MKGGRSPPLKERRPPPDSLLIPPPPPPLEKIKRGRVFFSPPGGLLPPRFGPHKNGFEVVHSVHAPPEGLPPSLCFRLPCPGVEGPRPHFSSPGGSNRAVPSEDSAYFLPRSGRGRRRAHRRCPSRHPAALGFPGAPSRTTSTYPARGVARGRVAGRAGRRRRGARTTAPCRGRRPPHRRALAAPIAVFTGGPLLGLGATLGDRFRRGSVMKSQRPPGSSTASISTRTSSIASS